MERKIHNFDSKILVEETITYYGYHPNKLGRTSTKFIIAICRFCGQPSHIRKGFYTKSGSACHKACRLKEQSQLGSPFADESIRKKARQTNQKRYGVEYASQNPDIAQKIAATKSKSFPASFTDLRKRFDRLNAEYAVENQVLVFSSAKYAVSCHSNDELVKPEKVRFCMNQTVAYKKRNIHVFHLFEHYWLRKRQVINFISSQLGLNKNRVMARKCYVDNSRQDDFLNRYHIQGSANLVLANFNLVYDGRVVAVITASRHHRQNSSKDAVVLSRLCFEPNYTVQGGSSKLFSQFKKWATKQGYCSIISWSDNAWTTGGVYEVLGFKLEAEYPPDYFYWDIKNKKYVSKQSQQKKKTGCPDGMTEREWCMKRSLYRIWDCGKKKWVFDLRN